VRHLRLLPLPALRPQVQAPRRAQGPHGEVPQQVQHDLDQSAPYHVQPAPNGLHCVAALLGGRQRQPDGGV